MGVLMHSVLTDIPLIYTNDKPFTFLDRMPPQYSELLEEHLGIPFKNGILRTPQGDEIVGPLEEDAEEDLLLKLSLNGANLSGTGVEIVFVNGTNNVIKVNYKNKTRTTFSPNRMFIYDDYKVHGLTNRIIRIQDQKNNDEVVDTFEVRTSYDLLKEGKFDRFNIQGDVETKAYVFDNNIVKVYGAYKDIEDFPMHFISRRLRFAINYVYGIKSEDMDILPIDRQSWNRSKNIYENSKYIKFKNNMRTTKSINEYFKTKC